MRLQLEVCRHKLPPVKILWQTDDSTIISDLLAEIDPSVPLQSNEWGLEDYILETEAGFEALHYQKVGDILRENDRLRIRPLTTNDIRTRRLTARTQIHSGGRHLTDGIAYGQPMLKQPVRARLSIAPRKTVDWINAADDAFDHAQKDGEYESDDMQSDGDYEDEDAESLREKICHCRRCERADRGSLCGSPANTALVPFHKASRCDVNGVYDEDPQDDESEEEYQDEEDKEGSQDDEDDECSQYDEDEEEERVDESSGSCSASGDGESEVSDERALENPRKRVQWDLSTDPKGPDAAIPRDPEVAAIRPPSKRLKQSHDSLQMAQQTSNPVTPRVSTESPSQPSPTPRVEYDEQPHVPPGAGKASTRARNKRRKLGNTLKYYKNDGILPQDANKKDLLDLLERGVRPSSKNPQSAKQAQRPPSVNDLSSGSEESTGSDEDDTVSSSSSSLSESSSSLSGSSEEVSSSNESLRSGKNSPRDATCDSVKDGDNQRAGKDASTSDNVEFQKRRQALLAQIANGGVDVGSTDSVFAPLTDDGGTEGGRHNDRALANGAEHGAESGRQRARQNEASGQKRLDVGSSQRMLLGSLGHRAPRSAEERTALTARLDPSCQKKKSATSIPLLDNPISTSLGQKAKNDPKLKSLMQKVASKTASSKENKEWLDIVEKCKADLEAAAGLQDNYDPDFWKRHIELTAVECCDEDVQLSTPPFPFYQRWDPSQQRGKKRKRNSQHAVSEDYYFEDTTGDGLNYDDETEEAHVNGSEHPNHAAGENIEHDLPPVPANIESLKKITEADLHSGDIIVFKNLDVSAATNWTPAITALRTAKIVNEKLEPGEPLQLRLADRDLPEHTYDEDGNRVYEKFEMQAPDEDAEDEGLLYLAFSDLVEPRLLEAGQGNTV